MELLKDSIESVNKLNKNTTYIYSTAPWDNPNAWKQKVDWEALVIKRKMYFKKVILSHHKNLN